MGTSGGCVTLPAPGPTSFRIAVPTLPLIAIGTYNAVIDWDTPFPDAAYSYFMAQGALLGKAVAAIIGQTSTGFSLRVTASFLLAAGAQIHVLAWA